MIRPIRQTALVGLGQWLRVFLTVSGAAAGCAASDFCAGADEAVARRPNCGDGGIESPALRWFDERAPQQPPGPWPPSNSRSRLLIF